MRKSSTLVFRLLFLFLGGQPIWAESPPIMPIPPSQADFTEFLRIKELPHIEIANYSLALTTFGEIAAGHDHDLSHGFAWATMVVKQVNRWGRVGAGVTHELVLIHTDKGFMVVEPQNGTHARLADYPNREHIRSVFFN